MMMQNGTRSCEEVTWHLGGKGHTSARNPTRLAPQLQQPASSPMGVGARSAARDATASNRSLGAGWPMLMSWMELGGSNYQRKGGLCFKALVVQRTQLQQKQRERARRSCVCTWPG